jgi:hypothetical protein
MKDFLIQKYIDYKFKRLEKDSKLYESKFLKKEGVVLANHKRLDHIWLCAGTLPKFYIDIPFQCKDCGSQEIWKAEKQKHYFEEMKGKHLEAIAIRCKNCRIIEKQRIAKQKQHMNQIEELEPHPNNLFFNDLETYKKTK